MQNETIDFYDNFTKRQVAMGVNERHKSIIKWLKKFGLRSNISILEIGCGIGTLSGLLAKKIGKEGSLVSMDISPKSIEIAKQQYDKLKNAQFVCGDINEYSFDRTFDIIVFPDVLEHIPKENHQKILNKCEILLKDTGFILIHIPDPLYLNWVRENHPEQLQIIDLSLTLEHFSHILMNTGLYMTFMNSYSIWNSPFDYQVLILKKPKKKMIFCSENKSFIKRLISKIINSNIIKL